MRVPAGIRRAGGRVFDFRSELGQHGRGMKIVRYTDPDYAERLEAICKASSLFDPAIESRVRRIIQQVAEGGDEALVALTRRFDGAALRPGTLRVSEAELAAARRAVSPRLARAVRMAQKNIAEHSRRSLRKDWEMRNAQGARVGEKFDPFERVGVYVPGGAAPLVSTALMTIVLAKTAGCREIVVCTPCSRDGTVNPALLYAAQRAGATEIYRVGGAQAIAAMALGSESIAPAQKIFGPGNAYVVAAKRLLFGYVAVDLLPGPSELLVVADETAPARFVAADLLAQAEHGSGHERVWLATPSAALIEAVQEEMEQQLKTLSRRELIARTMEANGWAIQVKDLDEAAAAANRLAPEHCEIMVKNPRSMLKAIKTAGAIFVGPWSPTVLGDYVAGPSHTLPTGGAGRSFAGLTADQFQRRTSVIQYSRAALKASIEAVETFAELEGLSAHGRSATLRLES